MGPDVCGARRTMWRRMGLVLLSLLAFVAATIVVGSLQQPLRELTREARFEAFLAQKDRVDAVFIGSSRIQRGVSPRVIDAQLSSPDREFRSFNLGIPGMRSFEADSLVRRVLASKPERLRFLVIEAPRFQPEIVPIHGVTERWVDWHDLRATWLVLRALWRSRASLTTKVDVSLERLSAFLRRGSNYATLDRFAAGPEPVWDEIVGGWSAQQGFRPLDEGVQGASRRRKRFLREQPRYRARVAAMRKHAAAGELADPDSVEVYDLRALEEQIERIEAAGIIPVYLASPVLARGPDFREFQRRGVFDHLIDLRSPLEYPELFAVENRFDREHMDAAGSILLSEAIASELRRIRAASSSRGSS